jgi:hypothetical protein
MLRLMPIFSCKSISRFDSSGKTSGKIKIFNTSSNSITEIKYKLINGAIADSKKSMQMVLKLYDLIC